jgi:type IV secretion system protein VirB11
MEVTEIKRVKRDVTVRSLMRRYGLTDALNSGITDFAINRPLEYWIENQDGWGSAIKNESLTLSNVQSLATAIAVFNKKELDQDHPHDSFVLPDGERCHIILPPICQNGKVIFSIRKPSSERFSLRSYEETGRLNPAIAVLKNHVEQWEVELKELVHNGQFKSFFELAVKHKLNVVTVGGTGSGKTTFSKTLIDLYPKHKRLFIIEDEHELDTPEHANAVHLLFSPKFSAKSVLASCMRLKPDHIFLTELRGDETWDYLMALKSGHSGSVTSIHANDCRGALYKIGSYIKQSEVGKGLDLDYIMREVYTTIDVVVFFENTHLKEIYYDPDLKLRMLRGED